MTRLNQQNQSRYLIIRFSSLGDVGQALPVADLIKNKDPNAFVAWIVRDDLKGLLTLSPNVDRVIGFPRRLGLKGLVELAQQLSAEPWTHVYDAHNNVRSHVFMFFFRVFGWLKWRRSFQFIRRGKQRFNRFLYFQLGLPTIPQPFRGMISFLEPLKPWFGSASQLPASPKIAGKANDFIVLAPSASCELKRWPIENFAQVIRLLPNFRFALVGGPEDTFISDLVKVAPERVVNYAGQLDWRQTGELVSGCKMVISNDTGVAHIADWISKPAIALRGAAAFGHTTRDTSVIFEAKLSCQPCSKDGLKPCKNAIFKKCLLDITPDMIAHQARVVLASSSTASSSLHSS